MNTIRPRISHKPLVFLLLTIILFGALSTVLAAQPGGNDRLLAWIGKGDSPAKVSASEPGQLVLMDTTGAMEVLMPLPPQTSYVLPCGSPPQSADGKYFAFYVGGEKGTLYLLDDVRNLLTIKSNFQALGCVTGFRFSPDGSRIAYITYEDNAANSEFADGFLHVVNSALPDIDSGNIEKVTAFDITNNAIAFVQFYTTDKGEADEAAISLWTGDSPEEVTSLYADENCRFTSSQIAIGADNKLVVVMGQRCKKGDTRTSWQFYVVDASNGGSNRAMTSFQPGSFLPYARTNNLIFSPDRSTLYFAVPDGVTANTAILVAVDMGAISGDNVPLPRDVVMPRLTNKPYDWKDNPAPVISLDGRWLALVTNTPNNEAQINVFDMNNRTLPPLTASAGRRDSSVSSMVFTPDNNRLVYVAGGNGGDDNSVFALELGPGSSDRIKRGRYGHGVLSLDGSTMALMEWAKVEDPKEPPYLTLALVDVNSKQSTTIFVGAQIVNGKVNDQQFVYPLAWRRG